MKEYHKWLRNATVKPLIPNLDRYPRCYTAIFYQSAKLTPLLQAAVVYVNSKAKSYRSAAATPQRERAVVAARAFNPVRLAWK